MKKALCFILFICMAFSVGCQKQAVPEYESFRIAKVAAFPDNVDEIPASSERGYYNFSASLFSENKGDNALFAPLPLYVALGMTMNGAEGRTLREMQIAMCNTVENVNLFTRAANAEVAAASSRVSLANSIWIRDVYGEKVKESYLDKVADYYAPEIFSLPFDEQAVLLINSWAKDSTNGKIEKIIDGLDSNAVMELVSALYIKSGWTAEGKDLGQMSFKNQDGSEGKAKYFDGTSTLYFSDRAYAVKRGLEGDWFMLAVLPSEKENFNDYLADFDGEELYRLMNEVDPRGAKYVFPEFENENSLSLIPLLKNLGINDAFSDATADFSNMMKEVNGLYITEAEQKARISVTRTGLEGAATVRVEMGRKSSGDQVSDNAMQIDFNRPFLYFICTPKGVPVMQGTVTKL